ncbi:MAG: hypothetical protein PF485_14340 [Bacteroidales bacterium]|jgi:hypothetical protein|nr:hypothetical protein [Bacteroidales bacterium]
MNKILRIALIVLFSISALFTLLFYAGGEEINGVPRFTNLFIVWAYVLTGIAVGFTVIFPVIQMITNPKNAKKGLLGIAALVVIIVIAYALASGEVLGIKNPDLVKYDVHSTLKFAGMMLYSIYILAFVAIVSMAYSEVSKIFK